jgi:hypothetical protein
MKGIMNKLDRVLPALLLLIVGYNPASTQPVTGKSLTALQTDRTWPVRIQDMEEPSLWNAALKHSWQSFIGAGRYRMARLSDMHFSEQASHRLMDLHLTIWQAQYSTSRGLAVIVVDTNSNDDNRFGVVLFRPIHKKGKVTTDAYRQHWLYRKRDLSNVALYQISDSLQLYKIDADGSYSKCDIEWAEQQSRYLCR